MSAMPVMIVVLCVLAVAYRYYSAFLAARVAVLDDSRSTPAIKLDDGQNYHPTNKWVLFGHHFAAISGAGPLIGPVLAAQFGYLPGLIWIVIGVCLAGAVQDFLILAASIRSCGKSLAQIAYADIGKTAGTAATIAILFIIVIALAGLGKVVVKALGGDASPLPAGQIELPLGVQRISGDGNITTVPAGSTLIWNGGKSHATFDESFVIRLPTAGNVANWSIHFPQKLNGPLGIPLPAGTVRLTPGSPWGTFTIAATIPIALFVGIYMSRLRKGRIIEASLIGGALTLLAVFVGGWVANSQYASWFDLNAGGVTWAMAIYGFIAAVLPVWVLLTPRDYLSSFLKIGTIAILVIGTLIANPKFQAPAINHVFLAGGPTVPGRIFPFLFITIMCGAISGFHALVSSGTTSKMLARESDARMIGYGAMLIEGLVGVVSIIAAASLPVQDYYAMNTDLAAVPKWHDKILEVGGGAGPEHLNVYEALTHESLRGRTGGAVTLAVGMAHIFDGLAQRIGSGAWLNTMWKYWYHFAIMFEALFILTTIDAGTRIGRFLLQEIMGNLHPALGLSGGWPSAIISTAIIVLAWVYFLGSGPFATIWAMFGVANQMLAVIALAIAAVYLFNSGRGKYAWVAILPMIAVFTTTSSAAVLMLNGQLDGIRTQLNNTGFTLANATLFNALLQASLILMMLLCALIVLATATLKVWQITGNERIEIPSPLSAA